MLCLLSGSGRWAWAFSAQPDLETGTCWTSSEDLSFVLFCFVHSYDCTRMWLWGVCCAMPFVLQLFEAPDLKRLSDCSPWDWSKGFIRQALQLPEPFLIIQALAVILKYEDFVSPAQVGLLSHSWGLGDCNCSQNPYLTDRLLKELHLFASTNGRTVILTDLIWCSTGTSCRQFLGVEEEISSFH